MKTLDQIHLGENDRRAIEAAVAVLRRQFDVDRVLLFGSKARGDDIPESDIDLLVLTRGPVSYRDKERMTRALIELELQMGVVLSLLVMPVKKWRSALYRASPIRCQIEADGVAA